MFPYKDENPTILTPYVTVALIVVTSLIWLLYQSAGMDPAYSRSICDLGLIPSRLLSGESLPISTRYGLQTVCPDSPNFAWYTVVTSAFLHGGWFHLIGNMWFLWVFGNNIEDSMGHGRFVVFYLVCGALAAGAQVVSQPTSPVPMVGASGAVSGIMGAYLILYPRVRVHMIVFLLFFVTRITVPAYLMLLYWIVIQVFGGLPTLAGANQTGGVAFMAHVGGFIAGVVLIRLFAKPDLLEGHRIKTSVEVHTRRPRGLF